MIKFIKKTAESSFNPCNLCNPWIKYLLWRLIGYILPPN